MKASTLKLIPVLILAAGSLQLAAQQLPDAPNPRADNMALACFAAADTAAMLADAKITADATRIPGFYEMDPLYSRNPSPRRVYLQMALTTAAVDVLSWELKRHHKRWWAAPLLIDTVFHFVGATQTVEAEPR